MKDGVRKKILRIHGLILMTLGVLMPLNLLVGTYLKKGVFSFMQPLEVGVGALFLAYLLVGFNGIILWTGSNFERLKTFHLLAIGMHIPPFLANFFFWGVYDAMGKAHLVLLAFLLHIILISLEGYAFLHPDEAKKKV